MKFPNETREQKARRIERKIMLTRVGAIGIIQLWNMGGGGFDADSRDLFRRLHRQHGEDTPNAARRLILSAERAHVRLRAAYLGAAKGAR